jgi:poly(3-hydroxyoctanoate) depolymerase
MTRMWGAEETLTVDQHPLRVVRSGGGPPLLLINGIGASAEMWAPLVDHMPANELVAVDLPGTGSSPPARRPLRIRSLALLLTRLLDQLGYPSVDVLGYSFGGIVAQELAWRAPDRVRRLILCASSAGAATLPPRPLPALLMLTPTRYQNRTVARYLLPLIAGGQTRRDPGVLEATLADRLANPPSRRGYLHQLYAVTGWTSNPWLRRIRHRTLVVHGDDDPLVPLVNARNMAKIIPNARLHVVHGGGHLFLLDEPQSVADELTAFLAR